MKKIFATSILSMLLSIPVMAKVEVIDLGSGSERHLYISGNTAQTIQNVLKTQDVFTLQELFRGESVYTDGFHGNPRVLVSGLDLGVLKHSKDDKLLTAGAPAFGVTQNGVVVITGPLANILAKAGFLDSGSNALIYCFSIKTSNAPGFPATTHTRCEIK